MTARKHTLVRAAAAGALVLVIGGQAAAADPPPALRTKLEEVVRSGPPGLTAMVLKDGELLYRLDVGTIAPDAQLPVASASKWMTAALIMTLVDEGKLSLDEPIGRRLPDFQGEAAAITLRQILSYTAGQGDLTGFVDLSQDSGVTLAESARLIAARPLKDRPGSTFRYGAPSFQVAGALAEQVTGKSWAQLFQERIAGPLGLKHTAWGYPTRPLDPAGVRNPNLQAGVWTTAADYAAFLHMLAGRGQANGVRILSEAGFDEMERIQTANADMAYKPPGATRLDAYALGNWCETVKADGACGLVSSPGAFGTYPWLDRDSGLYGVFFLKDRLPNVAAGLVEARSIVLEAESRP